MKIDKKKVEKLMKTMNYYYCNMKIPAHMWQPLAYYVMYGIPVGSFLRAVLSNDLNSAVLNAGHININNIPAYIHWLYNNAPSGCYGSEKIYINWIAKHSEE